MMKTRQAKIEWRAPSGGCPTLYIDGEHRGQVFFNHTRNAWGGSVNNPRHKPYYSKTAATACEYQGNAMRKMERLALADHYRGRNIMSIARQQVPRWMRGTRNAARYHAWRIARRVSPTARRQAARIKAARDAGANIIIVSE